MATLFANNPGYAGYFGPFRGKKAIIGFGTTEANADKAAADLSQSWGFLVEGYTVRQSRPVQVKYFLNTTQPAAVAGYAQGTVQCTGMVGTYQAFQNIIGAASAGTKEAANDLCNGLVCVINNSSSFTPCSSTANAAGNGIKFVCSGLILQDFQVTGQVDQAGVLFQQATVVFTLNSLDIKEDTTNKVAMRTPGQAAAQMSNLA